MVCRTKALVTLGAGLALAATMVRAQEPPNPQFVQKLEMQGQVQRIVQERPREAEAAARAFLHVIAMKDQPPFKVEDRLRELDSLKAHAVDAYWVEVAQLTVPRFTNPHYQEFVVTVKGRKGTALKLQKRLLVQGVQAGKNLVKDFPELGESLLLCVTETTSQQSIDKLRLLLGKYVET